MARLGSIEILACKAASIRKSTIEPEKGPNQYPADLRNEYFGGYMKEPIRLQRSGYDFSVVPLEMDERPARRAMIDSVSASFLGPRENGLQLCLTLAHGSGAIMRASGMSQVEEFGNYRDDYGREA